MAGPVDRYLSELSEASAKLDPDLRAALLDEIRSHLDCAILARLEMGEPFAQAEAAAVASLGPAPRLAREVGGVHDEPKIDRRMFAASVLFIAGLAVLAALDGHGVLSGSAMLWAFAAFHGPLLVFMAARSFQCRRFQWRSLLILYPVLTLWMALVCATIYSPHGPKYSELPRIAAETRELSTQQRAAADRLQEAYARFEQGENIAPVTIGYGWQLHPQVESVATREEAQKRWNRVANVQYGLSVDVVNRQAAIYEATDRRLWFMSVPKQVVEVQGATFPFTVVVGIYWFFFWFLGAVVRLVRRFYPPESRTPVS
jgi:hypothetical protein